MQYRKTSTLWLLLLGALSLIFSTAGLADEEEQDPLHLKYIGEQYLLVTIADKKGQPLVHRKLIQGQSFPLKHLNAKGKKHKQFAVKVGKRKLLLKLACSPKQLKKQLGADVFNIQFVAELFKKPPCFTKDDGPEANIIERANT